MYILPKIESMVGTNETFSSIHTYHSSPLLFRNITREKLNIKKLIYEQKHKRNTALSYR